jgi:hypothetical protein
LLPFKTGAGEEARTLDLNLGKVALYQLSYSRNQQHLHLFYYANKTGAGEEARTLDLNLGKVALYQLSYSRKQIQQHLFTTPISWSGRRGSNSRPQPWQGCALPTELLPHQQQAHIIYEPPLLSRDFVSTALLRVHVSSSKSRQMTGVFFY